MPRNARCIVPGTPYHVTQRGTNQQRVFFTASDRATYLRLLKANLAPTETKALAWCLMTNHVHLVLVPGQEDSLEVLLRRVHGRYAQMVNARRLRTGHLWQNRFFSCPLSSSHLHRVLVYVERNPVRAGLVEKPEHYEWSSAAVHLGLVRDRFHLLNARETGEPHAPANEAGWRELLSTPEEAMSLRLLRRCTYAGRPLGEEDFLAAMERRFGRNWRRWSFEKQARSAA